MPEPDFDSATYADLAEVALAVSREVRLREHDLADVISLTPSNAQVMRFLDAHPGATATQAAEGTGLLRSNLSAALRELQQIGFLEKRRNESDGRGARLHPTAKAARNLAQVREQWAQEVERILGGPDGVAEATELLRRLADGLADERRATGLRGGRRQL